MGRCQRGDDVRETQLNCDACVSLLYVRVCVWVCSGLRPVLLEPSGWKNPACWVFAERRKHTNTSTQHSHAKTKANEKNGLGRNKMPVSSFTLSNYLSSASFAQCSPHAINPVFLCCATILYLRVFATWRLTSTTLKMLRSRLITTRCNCTLKTKPH